MLRAVLLQKIPKGKILLFCIIGVLIVLMCAGKVCFADSGRISGRYSESVVAVYSYDADGNQAGQATGFVVRKDGVVATSYQIAGGAALIMIKKGEQMLEVRGLLYADRENGLVLLKTEDANLTEVQIQTADAVREGQKIFLQESSPDEEKSILEGTLLKIIKIAPGRNLLQISVPVTRGMSGAPVFNEEGKVIGIAAFFTDETQSVFFAMPADGIRSGLALTNVVPLHKAKLQAREENAEFWFNLGAVYESLGLYSYASGSYQRALSINPDDPIARINLGIIYLHLDINSFAVRELSEAISLKPDYHDAYYHLGTAYSRSGMHKEAGESFEKAIGLKPDDVKSLHGRAVVLFQTERFGEAVNAFKEVIRLDPDYSEVHYNLGVTYQRLNRNDEAIAAFQRSIELKPEFPKPHFGLGIIYSASDPVLAEKHARELEKLDPEKAIELEGIIKARSSGSAGLRDSGADTSEKKKVAAGQNPVNAGSAGKNEIYSVQVSYLQNKKNAEAFIGKLKKKGYKAFLKEEKDVTGYRVLIGKFSSKEAAADYATTIHIKEKMDTLIYRH